MIFRQNIWPINQQGPRPLTQLAILPVTQLEIWPETQLAIRSATQLAIWPETQQADRPETQLEKLSVNQLAILQNILPDQDMGTQTALQIKLSHLLPRETHFLQKGTKMNNLKSRPISRNKFAPLTKQS